jgi:anti-sigma B factor antagonist
MPDPILPIMDAASSDGSAHPPLESTTAVVTADLPAPGVAEIAVGGRLDPLGALALREELARLVEAGAVNAVVDLSAVTEMDAAGLAAVVHGHRLLTARGGTLVVVGAGDAAMRVIRLTGLDLALPIVGLRGERMRDAA